MRWQEAQDLAGRVATAATEGVPADWLAHGGELGRLDGRSWLLLDQVARKFTFAGGTPVSGTRGWLGPQLSEPSGFVAAATSLHLDGRMRERAVLVLAAIESRVSTAALTVRLLDHVPQVRTRAWHGLRLRLNLETAELVLDILLAGRNRQHADTALVWVQERLLQTTTGPELVSHLTQSDRRQVRRWAFTFGYTRDLLSPEDLVSAARQDPDQWLRATTAGWLMDVADPARLTELLDANSVEARLVALTRIPNDLLDDDALGDLLIDRAPRVREQARWRARRREFEVVSFYRRQAVESHTPRVLAACLDGLALVGDRTDLPISAENLQHPRVRVRAAAVNAVLVHAQPEDAVELITPMLLDPSARVSSAAARGLAQLGVPPPTADAAWASARPASRRAAWRLARGAGGWDRVEADLRAAGDPDLRVSSLGEAGIRNWLDNHAATTWDPLPVEQRARLSTLLPASSLDGELRRVVAFHAGIKRPASDETNGPASATLKKRPFWRWTLRS